MKKITPSDLPMWNKHSENRGIFSFTIELTDRCNFKCRHCYICEDATSAKDKELSADEILAVAKDAVKRGALWCTLTGGEPLLREDFPEIYIGLKKLGLLVTVFTNGSLITEKHIELFKTYPPYCIEITVYGMSENTYERVTGIKNSYNAVMKNLEALRMAEIPYRLKAMVIRSNYSEFGKISDFSKQNTMDFYRFDPFLHLRADGDEAKNKIIKEEIITDEEVLAVESTDKNRMNFLESLCRAVDKAEPVKENLSEVPLFRCGAGLKSFVLGADGYVRLCSSLFKKEYCYDIRSGSLDDYWDNFVDKVRSKKSSDKEFINDCASCKYIDFCMWCPAHAELESGRPDSKIERFCSLAKKRYEMAKSKKEGESE